MVTFAPQIQTPGDPEYLRYSRAIPQPEGDKSGAILGKGIGDAAEEAIGGVSKVVGAYAENKTYEQLNEAAEKEGRNLDVKEASLLGTPQNPDENTQLQPSKTDPTGSLVTGQDVPTPVTNGTKSIASLKERYDHGKISETDYLSDRARILKDLNAQFPMWRAQITAGASRATGEGSADALIRARISDYNSIVSKLNEQRGKIDSHILSGLKDVADPELRDSIVNNHFGKQPGDPGYVDEFTSLHHVLNAQSRDIDQKRRETDLTIDEKQNTVDKIKVGRNVNSTISDTVENWKQNLMINNGANTWDELQDKVRKVQANPDSVEGQKLANDIAQSISKLKADMYKNTRFAARTMGGDLDKSLNEAGTYFDRLAHDAVGGDVSKLGNIVSSAGNAAAAIQQNAKLGWLKVPGFGGALADYEALNSIAPEVAKTYLDTFQSVVKNAGPIIGNHFQETMAKGMSTPPGGDKNNKPINMSERIDQAHTIGASPATLQGYINFIDNIKTMPKTQARNMAYMYYGSENLGMLGKWAKDAYDYRTGKTAEGQGTILEKMGDKETLDKIWSLGDPKLNNQVQNFLEDAVSNRVFPSLMKDLEGTSKFGLAYDNKTQEFVIRNPKEQMREQGPFSFPHGTSNYAQATQTIKQLNNVMRVVRNLGSHLGKDPNAYAVELITAGNPNVGKDMSGVPAETESAAVRALGNQVLAKKLKEQNKEKTNP